MSRTIFRALVLLALLGATARGADEGDALRTRIAALTAPELAGRLAGSGGEAAAADSLAHWLRRAGLEPGFADGWRQHFTLRGDSLGGRPSVNVAGVLPGSGLLAGRWLVMGAHLDHLGRVATTDTTSLPAPGEYYPGANDNASGLVALAAAVEALAADATAGARRSLLVVGFGAEEVGLQGSAWLVDHLPVVRDSIDVMLNLDTVGVLSSEGLYVGGVGTADPLAAFVRDAAAGELATVISRSGWSGGDHVSFLVDRIPSLALFGGPYPQYNTPEDDLAVIDLAGLVGVAAYAGRLGDSLRRAPGPFEYRDVAPLADAQATGGRRETWFGTVPDFGGDTTGYVIGQVVPDGPAARGGLRDGDILLSLGGEPVTDLGTFTRALRRHEPREPVEVEIQRSGRLLRFTVVLGSRAER